MLHIDRNARIPLIVQVSNLIETRIATGVYKKGEAIPSERTLCGEMGIFAYHHALGHCAAR